MEEWPGDRPLIIPWLVVASRQELARQLDQMRDRMPANGFVCAPPRNCRHAHVPVEAANDDLTVDKTFRGLADIEYRSDVDEDEAVSAALLGRAIMERIQGLVESSVYHLIHADARRYCITRAELIPDDFLLRLSVKLTVNYTDAPLADIPSPSN